MNSLPCFDNQQVLIGLQLEADDEGLGHPVPDQRGQHLGNKGQLEVRNPFGALQLVLPHLKFIEHI